MHKRAPTRSKTPPLRIPGAFPLDSSNSSSPSPSPTDLQSRESDKVKPARVTCSLICKGSAADIWLCHALDSSPKAIGDEDQPHDSEGNLTRPILLEPLSGDSKPPTSPVGTIISDLKRYSGGFHLPLGEGSTHTYPELFRPGMGMRQPIKTEVKKVMRVVPGNFRNTSRSQGGDVLLRLRKNFGTKFELWMSLGHPNIARIRRVAPDELTLYQEYCSSGDLREYVKRNLSEIDYIRIIANILSGLSYLHSRETPIAHGCINPGKIYVVRGTAKLGEFGLSQMVAKIPHLVPSIFVTGMTRWMSPDYFRGPKPGVFTTHGDIWSFGCTLLELLTGTLPYHQSKYDAQVLTNIMSDVLPGELEPASYKKGELSYASTRLIEHFITECWFPTGERPSSRGLSEQRIYRTAANQGGDPKATKFLLQHGQESDVPRKPVTTPTIISDRMASDTSIEEIFSYLIRHCCIDMTPHLDSSVGTRVVMVGGWADIFSGHLHNGTKVALKVSRQRISEDPLKLCDLSPAHEIYIWSRCNHPNILPLIGATIFQHAITLVTPWIEQGDLRRWIRSNRSGELDHLGICVQITNGLSYLHSTGVIHGDIKGPNILMSDDMIPKICDFGQAVLLKPDNTLKFDTKFGYGISLRWAAPERVLWNGGGEGMRPTVQSDVYSLGMTILEVITGDVPWAELKDHSIIRRIFEEGHPRRPQLPFQDDQADHIWKLLTRCWDREPSNRPTAAEVGDILNEIIAKKGNL